MAEFSLKQQFVRLLRDVLRGSGMTRGELIDRLGISASAVSQMLNGDLLPTAQRLDRIVEILHPSADDAEKLQNMMLWLRSGADRYLSEFNRRLFLARCECRLSIEQLAMASAIPAARLRRLERTAYAEPTPEEVVTLSGILGQPLEDGVLVADPASERTAPLEVADSPTMMLPRITAESLRAYDADEAFEHFVAAHSVGFLAFHLLPAEAAAVVAAPTERFGVSLPGKLELVLGSSRPRGFIRIDLCAASDGGFFMDGNAALYGSGSLPKRKKRDAVRWRLPVLQVNHIPEVGSDGQG